MFGCICAFSKREGARGCRRACVRSEDGSIVQMHDDSSACVCVCNFACMRVQTRDFIRELDTVFETGSSLNAGEEPQVE